LEPIETVLYKDLAMNKHDLHIKTPLVQSLPLSKRVAGTVWLKMEALQPSGSFKLRGIGRACQHYEGQGARKFISSSGGNAGIAVAYAGSKLNIPVTVVVPKLTSERAIELIRQEEAEVIIKGETWQESHAYALNLSDSSSVYIHPFDNPLLWPGHATMIDEVLDSGVSPDAVVLSVGGGGLLCGVLEGLHRNGLGHVPVIAVETEGAASLSASLQAGRHIEIDSITSIATTLGAKKVAEKAFEWCAQHEVISHVLSDQAALEACMNFSTDHRLLVEPACGASLAALYNPHPLLKDKKDILVIVCGGAGVSIAQLERWQEMFEK